MLSKSKLISLHLLLWLLLLLLLVNNGLNGTSIFLFELNESLNRRFGTKLASKLENNKAYKQMQDKNLCPLCIKKRTNECVLSVSGFVFCYVCIFKFVREHQRCPLTNYPCTIKNIIRIYDSSD